MRNNNKERGIYVDKKQYIIGKEYDVSVIYVNTFASFDLLAIKTQNKHTDKEPNTL